MLLLVAGAPAVRAQGDAPLQPLVGEERRVLVQRGQTLLDIAFEHRLGFDPLARRNPHLDPWIPAPGSVVLLPTRQILPHAEPEGLVVNVPEMRLYDFTVDPVRVFAIAIGDTEDPTILGEFRVGAKRTDPAWRVPQSILEERPGLPPVVEPGEDNPLGSRWITVGNTSYGIHGTNIRWSIGRMATHGCIRLYEEEIQELFERVPPGARLQIVYQPFKWGTAGGRIFLEVHPDVYGRTPDLLGAAIALPRERGLLEQLDLEEVRAAVDAAQGVPMPVGWLPGVTPRDPTSRPIW